MMKWSMTDVPMPRFRCDNLQMATATGSGVTTYGKSIVQKFVPLPSGGGVYMTVAHYTTPDMKAIKAGGIRPDVIVDLTALALRDSDSSTKGAPATPKPKDDLILQKALQLFSEPAAKKAA